jgi:UDP-N-acetylglucosamine diphosphorylase/glucosamine-1-phosphate N-acetyltransferase
VLGAQAASFVGAPHLASFEELDAPRAAEETLPAGAIVVNARFAPALSESAIGRDEVAAWRCEGQVAAVRLSQPLALERLADGTLALDTLVPAGATAADVAGWWMEAPWSYVAQLSPMLLSDVAVLGPALTPQAHDAIVIGGHAVFVEQGATVEPHVVFDTMLGPVLVRTGASVQAFTRVVGPCYVGPHSTVMADRISGCAIGEWCRVHGEISASIVLGHANKSHDGFVGHSYLGRWVNLGAGTTTSNLKNTYGTVALWTPSGVRDTGLQFLGTLFGDHAKTGIGLRLTTGCVIGAGANVYDGMPPKAVAPFAWGGGVPYASYDPEKFVDVAARAMARRQVTLGERGRAALRAAHARGTAMRIDLARER